MSTPHPFRRFLLRWACVAVMAIAGCVPAEAADQLVTLRITVTNPPAAGATLIINADTRTWTNSVANPANQVLMSTNGVGGNATNLYAHLTLYGYTGPLVLGFSSSNQVTLRGQINQAMSATASAGWASISYSTNTVTTMVPVRVPGSGESVALRRYVADQLVQTIADNATSNALPASANALSNHVNRSTDQTISGAKTFLGALRAADIQTTNLVNQGNAIRSPGSGLDSEQFGKNAKATNDSALAVGVGATAGGAVSTAIGNSAVAVTGAGALAVGYAATATRDDAIAIGSGSSASATNAVAVGSGAQASGRDSIVLGQGATDDGYTNTAVIGRGASPSGHSQIVLGGAGHTVRVPGRIDGPTISNATYNGTIGQLNGGVITGATVHATGGKLDGVTVTNAPVHSTALNGTVGTLTGGAHVGTLVTNSTIANATMRGTTLLDGTTTFGLNTYSSLANGANAGVNFGDYTLVKLTVGPTGAFSIAGIAVGAAGRLLIIHNATAQNLTWSHESGVESTAGNRITTLTGADVTTTGAGAAILYYDSAASRWILLVSTP